MYSCSYFRTCYNFSLPPALLYIIIIIIRNINMFKGVLYYKLESLSARVLAPLFRRTGQSVYRQGVAFQGQLGHEDRIVPSLRCVPISDAKFPRLLDVSRNFKINNSKG
jgi:hypothetical protein